MKMKALAVILIVAILVFSGCVAEEQPPLPPNGAQLNHTVNNSTGSGVGIPNPASKFCVDAGYKLELRDSTGYCVFPNGRECEEWKFFRGECTDADSFTLLQAAGYVAEPKELEYKYYADGRLTLTERWMRNGSSSTLTAWLTPSDFAEFAKKVENRGFASFEDRYLTCSGSAGCPTDMPTMRLTLMKQGNEKTVAVYYPADRPEAIDAIVEEFKALYEKSAFLNVDITGCRLMRADLADTLSCFGCPKGISNPKCSEAPNPTWHEIAPDSTLGSCTVDAEGGCGYIPPKQMTRVICDSGKGHWQECGSACRGAPEGTACTMQCVQYCECGGIAGFGCPTGYFCGDYLPKGAADAMGICKPVA